jgi:sugar phosphate isomerase/epimerase
LQVSLSTGCLHHLSPDEIAESAVQSGFECVEVLLNHDLLDDIDLMARALKSRSLKATVVHAPFFLDGLISAPTRKQDAMAVGSLALEAALAVGAPALTVHPGKSAPLGCPTNEYVEMARTNLEDLRALSAANNVELLVENTSAFYILGIKVSGQLGSDAEEIEQFLGPVEAPRFRMTFDTSHASTVRRLTVDSFIREMGSRIASVHLSDTNGFVDHLPIGYGRVNFARVFGALRAIGFDGNITLEFRPRYSSIQELRRNRVLVETELQNKSPK